MTGATGGFLARVKVRRRKTMRTPTQKMKSVKCKCKKGKGMRTDERGKFSGAQRGLSKNERQLRTSLRQLIRDVLQKGYEKGWGKGRTQGFVAGYHKGWSDAHFWYQVARRDGGHQKPGRIDDTLQQPGLLQGGIQYAAKREFPHNCTQQVKSEVKTEASADDHTVEVKSEVQSEL